MNAILKNETKKVIHLLSKMGISSDIFDDFTHICFNGEGAIHQKSGHIPRLMGLLYLAKTKGLTIAAINQTVDFPNPQTLAAKTVRHIYSSVDFLSVREPISLEKVHTMGLEKAILIPDAAYGLPKLTQEEIELTCKKIGIDKPYVCFAGSSKLKRDQKSIGKVRRILKWLSQSTKLPIIFLANAKTDIWIANSLKDEFKYTILQPPAIYTDAIAIIAQASFLVGGRQHPNIFAYEYKTPYLALEGNTHKNRGVAKLQNYPIEPLPWDCDERSFKKALETLEKTHIDFSPIKIADFDIFNTKGKS